MLYETHVHNSSKCMLIVQDCIKFCRHICIGEFSHKQLCWFPRCNASKDFIQSLVAFEIRKVCYLVSWLHIMLVERFAYKRVLSYEFCSKFKGLFLNYWSNGGLFVPIFFHADSKYGNDNLNFWRKKNWQFWLCSFRKS